MNKKEMVTSDTTVKDLLECHPQVHQFFLDKGLLCLGCPTETFHTMADVSQEYRLNLNKLLRSINKAIRGDESSR